MKPLVIATRGSELAIRQAELVRDAIVSARPGVEVRIKKVRTAGDALVDSPRVSALDKGLFTGAIEDELLAGTADAAVHSLKDLPTELSDGLLIAAVPKREDPADALLSNGGACLNELPSGTVVLTGSPRRTAQVLHLRGDLKVRGVRGNVPTRVRKLRDRDAGAMVLAVAGLARLGMLGEIAERLDPAEFIPACGQGALAIEARADDTRTLDILAAMEHAATRLAVTAERAFLAGLGGGCLVPAGAYARRGDDGRCAITGMVADADGRRLLRCTISGVLDGEESAEALGRSLAEELRARGCQAILDDPRRKSRDEADR